MMDVPVFLVAIVVNLCLCLSVFVASEEVVFLQKPQNLTVFNLEKHFFLNCTVSKASPSGMDWFTVVDGSKQPICSSFLVERGEDCQPGYAVERPDNRTLNLIVFPRNVSLSDKSRIEFCCQFDNGQGKKSCAYLTLFLNGTSEADATGTTWLSTMPYTTGESTESSSQLAVIIGVAFAIIIIIIIIIAICCFVRRKKEKRTDGRSKPSQRMSDITERETLRNS